MIPTRTSGIGVAAVAAGVVLSILPATVAKDRTATNVTPPRVIAKSQRPPEFPPAARAARFEGEVTVRVTILPTGLPTNLLVIHSSHPKVGFEEAAIEAVKRWRFIPATHKGVPVEYETQYRLTFGRHGVGVAGGSQSAAAQGRSNASQSLGQAQKERPRNTGRGSRTSPRRR